MLRRIIMLVALVVGGEALWLAADVFRTEIDVRIGQPIKATVKDASQHSATDRYLEHLIHLGAPLRSSSALGYYSIDGSGDVNIIDGRLTPEMMLDYLDEWQHDRLATAQRRELTAKTEVRPFFSHGHDAAVVDAKRGRETATGKIVPARGKCVLAALDCQVILIPLADYRKAGLPMHEPSSARY